MMARITSALRRLSLEDVRADDLFELTVEDSAAWAAKDRRMLRDAAAYGKARGAAEALWRALAKRRPETWLHHLERSAGVTEDMMRVLIFDAEKKIDKNPRRGLTILLLADALAERLRESTVDVVAVLRGRATLLRAYALRQLGDYREALAELERAEEHYLATPQCSHEVAIVCYERAAIQFYIEDYEAAVHAARHALNLFSLLGDRRRVAKAQMILGGVFYERADLETALTIFTELEQTARAANDPEVLASAYQNLGATELQLGNIPAARAWIEKALRAFSALGIRSEAMRAEWAMARWYILTGERAVGLTRCRDVRTAFEGLGMYDAAGRVTLDLVGHLLDENRDAEAATLCREALAAFERSGARLSARRAVAYLQQAARTGQADSALVREVLRFLDRRTIGPDEEFVPERRSGPV
jgi:tetratricopeptide (TPR) repeat protein